MNERDNLLQTQLQDWRAHRALAGNARDRAYNIIRDKIINLEYKPGEPLSDKQLAEQLGMSRTPVHEAMIILATTNMVVLKPQIGTFVAPIDLAHVDLEQFSRYTMEKEVVTQACAHITEELVIEYEYNLRLYEEIANTEKEGAERRLLELDNAFHRIAYIAADKEANYVHMMDSMQHFERLRMLSLLCVDQVENCQDHAQISSAIVEGNVVRAMYWVERHMHRYQDNLRILRERFPSYFQSN